MDKLISDGFLVDTVEKTGKFIKQKDLFGLFDVIAIEKEDKPLLIQITCNKPHTHKPYIEFSKIYTGVHTSQWVWIDRKGFEVYHYVGGKVTKLLLK